MQHTSFHALVAGFLSLVLVAASFAGSGVTRKAATSKKATTPSVAAKKPSSTAKRTTSNRKRRSYSRWSEPSYAESTLGDRTEGEDLVVRGSAVAALGPYNGSVVVVDPHSGRILSIVNQRLAFRSGFQPCSTVKIVAALAALSEGIIERSTEMRLGSRLTMNLTEALARSNNPYFANLGVKLGFERVHYYSRLFGLGEKAGLDIPQEEPGILPSEPPANGGVGMMMSFGEGISQTPLELAALLSAIANGGTLHYLQYPRDQQEVERFVPRVKRHLDIAQWVPEVKPGMMGAVEYGTARRAAYDPNEPIYGKTGTCTDKREVGTHLGWFGSFNDVNGQRLVVVVLLTGGHAVSGPVASGVAGNVYRSLSSRHFFAGRRTTSPAGLVSIGSCCSW